MKKLVSYLKKEYARDGSSLVGIAIFIALVLAFMLMTREDTSADKKLLCDATAAATPIALHQGTLSARDCGKK